LDAAHKLSLGHDELLTKQPVLGDERLDEMVARMTGDDRRGPSPWLVTKVAPQMLLLSGSNLFPPVVKTCEAGFGPAALVFAREGAPGFR
jgi:hypothetical protein